MSEAKLSWIRRHSWERRPQAEGSETALALVYCCDGRYVADVHDSETPVLLPGTKARLRVVCESDVQSRAVADGMLRNVHPHDCSQRCEPWRLLAS
jgi:hypothetical protein